MFTFCLFLYYSKIFIFVKFFRKKFRRFVYVVKRYEPFSSKKEETKWYNVFIRLGAEP